MATKRRILRTRIQEILDSYGVLCTFTKEEPLIEAIADAAIEVLQVKKIPRKKPKQFELYPIAKALSIACLIDLEANRSKLFAEAKRLMKATPMPNPSLIVEHYHIGGTWYREDWRGKQGQPPTLGQVRLTWAKLVGGLTIEDSPVKEFTV